MNKLLLSPAIHPKLNTSLHYRKVDELSKRHQQLKEEFQATVGLLSC